MMILEFTIVFQSILICLIIVKIFFYSDYKQFLSKTDAINASIADLNNKFDDFRRREARALLISSKNAYDIKKLDEKN